MKRPGIDPKGEEFIDCGAETLGVGGKLLALRERGLDGITVVRLVLGGLGDAAPAGEDEFFLRASIRRRINSVVFAFFSASVSCWPLSPGPVFGVADAVLAVDADDGVFRGGVSFAPPCCLAFFAACNCARYSLRLAGDGADLAGGTVVLTAVGGFESMVDGDM